MIRENNLKQFVRRYRIPVLLLAAFIVGFGIRGNRPWTGSGHHPGSRPERSGRRRRRNGPAPCTRRSVSPNPGNAPSAVWTSFRSFRSTLPVNFRRGKITLSPQAVKLAEVQVSPVERRPVEKEIRLVGKIDYDETRRKAITAWIPGRIDRVYVDFTGTSVRAGEPLVNLYSPELRTAQEEMIQAKRAARELENSSLETMRETALRTVESSREKLRLLGLSSGQIQRIESSGKPETT